MLLQHRSALASDLLGINTVGRVSNLPCELSSPSNDVHLIGGALVGRVGFVVENDAHDRKVAADAGLAMSSRGLPVGYT